MQRWRQMPKRFCNLDRMIEVMEREGIEGLVLNGRHNVYYTSGFWQTGLHADEPYPCALVFSRHEPDHPIVLVNDISLANFIHQETWVHDLRPFRLLQVSQMDLSLEQQTLDRFVPEAHRSGPNYQAARDRYADHTSIGTSAIEALSDLGLSGRTVGTDNPRLMPALESVGCETRDVLWTMMDVRHVKTPFEIEVLTDATRINQTAQEVMVRSWETGMTFMEAYQAYNDEARRLGGQTMVPDVPAISPTSAPFTIMGNSTAEPDVVLEPGMNVMLDCHGVADGYCWDGGKTWRVGEPSPEGRARQRIEAAAEAMHVIADACVPNARTRDLQALGRDVLRKSGIRDADAAMIYFHGMGLSHVDMDMTQPDPSFSEDSLLAGHIYLPGDESERVFLEDIVHVTSSGGRSIFTWDPVDWATS